MGQRKLIVRAIGRSNFDAARGFAQFGLDKKAEGKRESASGPGSSAAAAAPCLDLLDRAIRDLSVSSIIDIGCGDWNWMQHARWYRENWPVRYQGWEAHEGMVEDLQRRFGRPGVSFSVTDGSTTKVPPVDLVICRDVLFHMPVEIAWRVLKWIRRSSRYLLASTYPGAPENPGPSVYLPIPGWGFYPMNLDIAPFNLAPFKMQAVDEPLCTTRSGFERQSCLYRLQQS